MIYDRKREGQRQKIFLSISVALTPPENIEIDEWAEKSIELSARVTKAPGKITLRPYQRKPLQEAKRWWRVVLVWAAQVGKTIVLQSLLGHDIDQDPGPTMVIYPDQQIAKRRSRKHLQPLIEDSPELAKHMTGKVDDMQLFEYNLDRMTINIAWSGSPSQMASEPIRKLRRDEFAKFAGATEKEADAMSLSERRTISFPHNRSIFDVTTPTIATAAGWRDLLNGTFEQRYWPCPHCGEFQVMVFKQFRYPKRETGESFINYTSRVKKNTYYECEHCNGEIIDSHKIAMDKAGEWRPKNPDADYASFHLSSWYSPDVKFGEVAKRYAEAEGDCEKMRDFMNSDCAEPYEEVGDNQDFNDILAHKINYDPGTIPTDEPCIIVMTSDIHADAQYYLIRAHTQTKSYLIEYGMFPEINELSQLMEKPFIDINGKEYNVHVALIDSGYLTTEVYDYCSHTRASVALKGMDTQANLIEYGDQYKYPGSSKNLIKPVKFLKIQTTHFKEELLRQLAAGFDADTHQFDAEEGKFFLHNQTGDTYARQLTNEYVIQHEDKKGYVKRTWKRRGKNHLFDCEVYQMAARWWLKNDLKNLTRH